jgi:hypothetical protein
MIPEPQRTYVLELLKAFGPAAATLSVFLSAGFFPVTKPTVTSSAS